MNQKLIILRRIKRYLSLTKSFAFFYVLWILILSTFVSLLNAQVGIGNCQQATVILQEGAEIFSKDEDFNKKILKEEIKIEGSNISYRKNKSHILIVTNGDQNNTLSKNFATQVKKNQRVKEEKSIKVVRQRIARYEKQKSASHQLQPVIRHPYNQFFKTQYVDKYSFVLNSSEHKIPNIKYAEYFYTIKRFLGILPIKEYDFFNNKSIDYCFSKVFSIRPPPQFI